MQCRVPRGNVFVPMLRPDEENLQLARFRAIGGYHEEGMSDKPVLVSTGDRLARDNLLARARAASGRRRNGWMGARCSSSWSRVSSCPSSFRYVIPPQATCNRGSRRRMTRR